jgi:hypothetical protein
VLATVKPWRTAAGLADRVAAVVAGPGHVHDPEGEHATGDALGADRPPARAG